MRSFCPRFVAWPGVSETSESYIRKAGKFFHTFSFKASPPFQLVRLSPSQTMDGKNLKKDYSDWSHENLVEKVKQLEAELEKKRAM